VVVQCGVGKVNAALAVQILIDRFGADAIINVGCAGSLNDSLDIGDFVVSSEVVQHDYDASAIGYEKGEILYTGKVSFSADETLITAALDAIATAAPERRVVTGRVCTGDQFISSDEEKETIISEFGGDCAEMEGAAVGQTAFLNGVPFVIIRAMSDKASSDAGSSDFTLYQEQVTKEGAEVVVEMVKNLKF
jgi:adenosylhomocysteine nucleosidase